MKKNNKIFIIMIIIICVLILPIKSYSTEIENEIENNTGYENNEGDNNSNIEEPENSETIQPPEDIEIEEPVIPPTSEEPTIEENQEETTQEPTTPEQTEEISKTEENLPPVQEENDNGYNSENNNIYIPPVEEKSNNNNLQSLAIEGYELEPEFQKNVTQYYLLVDLTVNELEITAITEDGKSWIDIKGDTDLQEGENIITITVTAENGTEKEYKIYVTKTDNAEAANANLKKMTVKGFALYPHFVGKIYKYNLTINEKITNIDIIAEAENEKATVEISGNKNLQEGNNIITITVTAEDGITKREYTINTFISTYNVEIQEENKIPAIIAIMVLLSIILILAIYLINHTKNSV